MVAQISLGKTAVCIKVCEFESWLCGPFQFPAHSFLGSSSWVLATHMGDSNQVLRSWFWSTPAPDVWTLEEMPTDKGALSVYAPPHSDFLFVKFLF